MFFFNASLSIAMQDTFNHGEVLSSRHRISTFPVPCFCCLEVISPDIQSLIQLYAISQSHDGRAAAAECMLENIKTILRLCVLP